MANFAVTAERRNILYVGAAIAAAVSIPAKAVADPVAAYSHELANNQEAREYRYMAAIDRMDAWQPSTHSDFVRKFVAMWQDQGFPHEKRIYIMLSQARHLLGDA